MNKLEGGISQKEQVKNQNLGKIPKSIRYVDSLAVFDTLINPYKKYEIAQKSSKRRSKAKVKVEEPTQEIKTIFSYEKPIYDPDNPKYKPNINDIKEIEFDD